MKKLLGLGLLLSIGCSDHKVNVFDSSKLTASCTIEVECEMDTIDDEDYYNLDDDEIYKQYLMERCVDSWNDNLTEAKIWGCGSEYKELSACLFENQIDECDYDDDEWEDLYEDLDERDDETCWSVENAFYECM